MTRILGIDPGLRNMGWGIVETDGIRFSHVAHGVVRSTSEVLAERLVELHDQLEKVLLAYEPVVAAVEQTFVNKDGAGTLKLGQARGVAMLVPAKAGLDVFEYAPNAVKKSVVGVGHADKAQVNYMVSLQLGSTKVQAADAADALAIAICHGLQHRGAGRMEAAIRKAAS